MGHSEAKGGDGAFILGFFLGGVIGAVIGVFKAPRSGKATRDMLLHQGTGMLSRAESAVIGERPADALAEGKAIARQRRKDLSHGLV